MKKDCVLVLLVFVLLVRSSLAQSDHFSTHVLFSGKIAANNPKRMAHPLQMTIRRLGLDAQAEAQNIPFKAFSVVTVYSGRVESTIDGVKTIRSPGDYWTVKAGAAMKARVLGESAVLEILNVTH